MRVSNRRCEIVADWTKPKSVTSGYISYNVAPTFVSKWFAISTDYVSNTVSQRYALNSNVDLSEYPKDEKLCCIVGRERSPFVGGGTGG